jgi:hypothetical protein
MGCIRAEQGHCERLLLTVGKGCCCAAEQTDCCQKSSHQLHHLLLPSFELQC